ncbi:MAG: hypothetical protein ACT4QD_18685 [Acidobacteriota bacterium]
MMRVGRIVTLAALCTGMAQAPGQAPQVPLGTWLGTVRQINNPNNRNSRPASLEVKKVPDPHWRWRSGEAEILSVTFRAQQDAFEVSTVTLDLRTFSFSFTHPEQGERIQCALAEQADGSYEGACTGAGFERQVTLRPPDTPPGPGR